MSQKPPSAHLAAAVCVAGLLNAAAPARFGDGCVTLEFTSGWNLICVPVIPREPSVASAFRPLGPALRGSHAYRPVKDGSAWQSYHPDCPPFLNSLEELTPGCPLLIELETPGHLEIAGVHARVSKGQ